MEWTAGQQMQFLFQSICLGLIQGVVFDAMTGIGKCRKTIGRLCLDIAYGPLAALLLFFGSLVIMDGQLHPLLIFGSIIGVIVEHVTIGVHLSKGVACLCRLLQTIGFMSEKTYAWLCAHIRKTVLVFYRGGGKGRKRAKNAEKSAK